MFKPTAKLKKLLGNPSNSATIYRDGVLIRHRETVKVNGTQQHIECYTFVPAEIGISHHCGKRVMSIEEVCNATFHDPCMLLDGLQSVDFSFDSGSQASDEKNLTICSATYRSASGAVHRSRWIANVLNPDIAPSPNPTNSFAPTTAHRSGVEVALHMRSQGHPVVILEAKEKKNASV